MYYQPDFSDEIIWVLRIVYGKRNLDDILRELEI